MTPPPHPSTHVGSVEAIGVVIDAGLIGEPEARQRILDLWCPGTSVFVVAHATWLVRWPTPRRLRCDRAPGLPVTVRGHLLTTAPLTDAALATLAAPPDALVYVHHGAYTVDPLSHELDLTTWLDVGTFESLTVTSLGEAPPAATLSIEPAAPVRGLFGTLVGAAPPEARDIAAALRASARHSRTSDRPAATRPGPWIAGAALAAVLTVLAVPFTAISGLAALTAISLLAMTAAAARRIVTAQPPRAEPDHVGPPSAPPPLTPSRLRERWTRLLDRTGLLRALGRRHAQYLQRMLAMFERGDFDAALRHAIPLADHADDAPKPLSLASPRARSELQIRPATTPPATSLPVDDDGFSLLRRVYRDAFERLTRAGRIEEAAFVLAELLHADEEAVAFLERHGRTRLAAEIAEARKLAPALVVRQWFLAGDRSRAVAIARLTGAFADAVARLEHDPARRDEAAGLRMLWADLLATSGDYATASDIVAPVPEASSLARTWLDRAIAGGGKVGARALARKLQRFPEALLAHRDRLRQLTAADDPTEASDRATLMTSLAGAPANPAVRAAIRPLLRALIADAARGEPVAEAQARKLADLLGDDPLRVDLPTWPTPHVPPLLNARTTPVTLSLGPAECGAIAIRDVVRLPDGKLLVALGELGVRLLARDGRVLWHADQPATALVISDHGDRAIAVIGRGRAVRLARLDLARRNADSWCEAQLDCWAPDFDGQTWLVGQGPRLLVIDVLAGPAPGLHALDHHDLGLEQLEQIVRSPTRCIVLAANDFCRSERWRWDLPAWTLRRRADAPYPDREPETTNREHVPYPARRTQSAQGEYVYCRRFFALAEGRSPTRTAPARLYVFHEDRPEPNTADVRGDPLRIAVAGRWIALATTVDGVLEIHLFDLDLLRLRLVVTLTGAADVALRLDADTLTLADDRGRVLSIELRHGAIERQLRVL